MQQYPPLTVTIRDPQGNITDTDQCDPCGDGSMAGAWARSTQVMLAQGQARAIAMVMLDNASATWELAKAEVPASA